MPRLPEFITFTGVDDHTDLSALFDLSLQFPVEWGVLASASRQGKDPRYPRDLGSFLPMEPSNRRRMRFALHLCGGYARAVSDRTWDYLPDPPALIRSFDRVQVNHRAPDVGHVVQFAREWGLQAIVQTREPLAFPATEQLHGGQRVSWLYDASGGEGRKPDRWPTHPGSDRLVGYAGGITPENVGEVIAAIDAPGPYWIDMESGVRTDDLFDAEKCCRVCEAVYAKGKA